METYDEIYGRMKNAYEHETGDSFNEVSDIAIRLKVLAGEIFKLQTNLEWWKRQMFAVTASGECLDKLASQRGIERKKAMKSTGEITFNISQPCSHDIIIPKGCVVATADLVPIRFVTTEDEEISAGNTLVSVYAEAEQAGGNGNIGLGCAVVPVSVPTEIETVTNREKFTGGCDAETDDELRKRIRDTYINTSNGTNAAYYEQLALTVDGVAKASAVGKVRGVGTVNVYVTGADASLGTNVVAKVQSLLEKQRELNVDVIVSNAQRTACNMSVVAYAEDGYSSGEVKELLKNAFAEYVNSIPIGGVEKATCTRKNSFTEIKEFFNDKPVERIVSNEWELTFVMKITDKTPFLERDSFKSLELDLAKKKIIYTDCKVLEFSSVTQSSGSILATVKISAYERKII